MRAYIAIAVVIGLTGRVNTKPQQSGTTSASDQTNSRPTCGSAAAVSHVASSTSFVRDDASPLNDNGGLASLHNSKTNLGIDTYRCAGSLISDQYLITAAHCMAERHGLIGIVLGRGNLTEKALPRDTYEIAEKFIHPNYDSSVAEYSDIAILRTNRKVLFGDRIWPYCLPEKNQVFGDYLAVKISGWGQVDQYWKVSPDVKTAFIKIVENKRCESLWLQRAPEIYEKDLKKFSYPQGITNMLLCAGREDVGSCKGDSGGPMSFQTSDGHNRVIGIVSKGLNNCPKEIITPGFYVNVPAFIDWIIEKTGLPKPVSINTPHSTVEDPSWCSLVTSSQLCSEKNFARQCQNFCSVETTELPKPVRIIPESTNTPHFPGSSSCQFPFIYKSVSYTACTVVDDPAGELWCSTKTDTQNNHIKDEWKYCRPNDTTVSTFGCDVDEQCGNYMRCQSRICFDQVYQRMCQVYQRIPHCVCPANTQGDARVQCLPITISEYAEVSDTAHLSDTEFFEYIGIKATMEQIF